jgi:predicted PurR-regulated permease PerM
MNVSFQKLFYILATFLASVAVLIFAQSILIPMGFALILSFIFYPLVKKLEFWGVNRIISVFIVIIFTFIVLGGGGFFFFTQIIQLPNELSSFGDKLTALLSDILLFINNNLSMKSDLEIGTVLSHLETWLKKSVFPIAESTLNNTTSFLTGLGATIIYTFLFLIYRKGLTEAFVKFAKPENSEKVLKMLKNVQKVGQKYLSGKLLMILILGIANSIGLWILDVDSPFLFGFLASILSVIPYIGTSAGAVIPVLYAFMTHDSLMTPALVALMFFTVQLVDDNFLSPKIVGSSMQVNALASILSLIIGAYVWGISGMILFLPFAAMLKVVCEEFDALEPIALLIGTNIYHGKEIEEKPIVKIVKNIKKMIKKG